MTFPLVISQAMFPGVATPVWTCRFATATKDTPKLADIKAAAAAQIGDATTPQEIHLMGLDSKGGAVDVKTEDQLLKFRQHGHHLTAYRK